ncbi:MAG TPA: adenylate/guanylate cyclase domain-containing protein [Anaerolineales bacterium]
MDLPEVSPLLPGKTGRLAPLVFAAFAVSVLLVTPFLALYWYQTPFAGFLIEANNMVNQASARGWPAHDAGAQSFDRLISINGKPVENPRQMMDFMRINGVKDLVLGFVRLDGSEHYVEVTPLPHFPLGDLFSLYIIPYGVGVLFLAIGLWAYNLRSDMTAGRVLLIYLSCVCIGVVGFLDLASTNQMVIIWTVALPFIGASVAHLAMVFPQPVQAVWERHWLLWLPWAAAAVMAVPMAWAVITPAPAIPLDEASWRWGYLYMLASTVFFIGMLVHNTFSSSQPLIRQQSRVIVFGALIGFLPIIFYLGPLAFDIQTQFRPWLIFIPLVVFPLSIAYSILRYRLLDVDRFLSRALGYVITLGAALLGFFALLAGLSALLNSVLKPNDPFVTGAYLLLLVLAFQPLRRAIQKAIDRFFYRSPADYRRVLTTLSQALVITPDLRQTMQVLEKELSQALAPAKFNVYLYSDEYGEYYPYATQDDSAPAYQLADPLVKTLEAARAPLWLPPDGPIPPELEGTLASARRLAGYAFVPLRYEGRLTGFMALGPRRSGVMYNSDDLDFLAAVAAQSALALENARLFTNLRRNLDQTLEMKNLMDDIFSSIATGVLTTDVQRNITLFNRAAEAIFGVPGKSVLGQPLSKALPVIGADLAEAADDTLKKGRSLLGTEFNRTLPERGDLYLRLSIAPLRDARSETRGATFVFEDLTQQRRVEAERERIRRTFGRVVAPRVRDRLLDDADRLRLDGVNQVITILFADLSGFTTFSEQHEPELVFSVLNSYLDLAAQAILEQEGTLDKFMGDAVMALWNCPDPQPDHAMRAVCAAQEIIRRSMLAHEKFTDPAQHMSFRIGVTTGPAIVGNVGTGELFNYTAIGDSVNLAQRLQAIAHHGQILLEKTTYDIVRDRVLAEPLERMLVRGRQQPVEVFALKGMR